MKSLAQYLLLALAVIVLTFCSKDEDSPDPQGDTIPEITSFEPVYGLPGTTVMIKGINFDETSTANKIAFNGVEAAVTHATETTLSVTVPEGATSGKIVLNVSEHMVSTTTDFEVLKDFPRNGLMGFWPFTTNGKERGLNNAEHEIGLDAAPIAPTLTTDRFGHFNQALNFDGTQSTFSNFRAIPNRPWTVSVWIDPGVFDNPIMGLMQANTGVKNLVFRLENNLSGDFFITVTGEDGTDAGEHGTTYGLVNEVSERYIPGAGTDNTWMHIMMSYDGAVFNIYKDNAIVFTNAVVTETPTPAYFTLGRIYSSYYFIGKMDDLAIYNRVLTAQERTQLFEQTLSKYEF